MRLLLSQPSSLLLRRALSPRSAPPPLRTVTAIAAGTDLTASTATWQRSRPWRTSDVDGSNLASDNAVAMSDLFGVGRRLAVFGVPAPFTGTCTYAHVPPYVKLADDFKRRGVDEIVCYSVTDPYAHHNWAESMGVSKSDITFLADADCGWAKEYGLDRDYAAVSLGVRSARFSMIVEDGMVKCFNIVEEAERDAEVLLGQA